MTNSFLSVSNVSCSYIDTNEKKLHALKDITFGVEKGEFIAIVGPSGCGKSTLLSCINGLLSSWKGSIFLEGVALKKPAKNIAMVFQSHSLLPWRNAIDNTAYGLEMQDIEKNKRLQIARRFLSLVGLGKFETFYPHELSGGMQQRVNLARALAINPQILLMDEPFAGLDAQTRELMQDELLRIWKKTKKTILFVTHQIDEAIYLADKVIVMSKRPAGIKKIITISLSRPRNLAVKQTIAFANIERKIWKLVMKEVPR